MALKWDGSDNLITFLATFQRAVGFLTKHNNATSATEALLVLQSAVENVPAFAQMANAAFYQTYPLIHEQTLVRLIEIYTQVYRAQVLIRPARPPRRPIASLIRRGETYWGSDELVRISYEEVIRQISHTTCLQSLNPMHLDFPKTDDLKGDQAQQFKCRKKGTSRKSRQKAKQCKARQDADEPHSNNAAIEEPSKVEDNTTSEIDIITRDIESNNQDTDDMEVAQEKRRKCPC